MPYSFSNLSQAHLRAGIQWLVNMSASDKWNLTDVEVMQLLGVVDVEAYQDLLEKYSNNEMLALSPDSVERLSLLLGIWRSLQMLVPANRQDLAISTFNKITNSPKLMNQSIKTYLLENNTIDVMYAVKRYLDANY